MMISIDAEKAFEKSKLPMTNIRKTKNEREISQPDQVYILKIMGLYHSWQGKNENFLPKAKYKGRMSLFNIVLEVGTRAIKQEIQMKDLQLENKK